MHHVLLIPEIVSEIIESGNGDPQLMRTCLTINSLFNLESTRIRWRQCGTELAWKLKGPAVGDLVRAIQRDLKRAQFYANFIKVLKLTNKMQNSGWPHYEMQQCDAKFFQYLGLLEFPMLQDIKFANHSGCTFNINAEIMAPFMQATLKNIRLSRIPGLSDGFLQLLGRCRLHILDIEDIDESNITQHGMTLFLRQMHYMGQLSITGLHDSWSSAAFDIISNMNTLQALILPLIQDAWIPVAGSFPRLHFLGGGLSGQALANIHTVVPDLSTLHIDLTRILPDTHRLILTETSNFKSLTTLLIKLNSNDHLVWSDLSILVKGCQSLKFLLIMDKESTQLSAVDITDDLMEEMAIYSPRLEHLSLCYERPNILSWRSIASLSRYCKCLQSLKMTTGKFFLSLLFTLPLSSLYLPS